MQPLLPSFLKQGLLQEDFWFFVGAVAIWTLFLKKSPDALKTFFAAFRKALHHSCTLKSPIYQ